MGTKKPCKQPTQNSSKCTEVFFSQPAFLFTGYVLKTDDDVFVDTFHLPMYLQIHGIEKKAKTEKFILCYAAENAVPGEEYKVMLSQAKLL